MPIPPNNYLNQFSAVKATEITPDDNTDLAFNKGLWVGTGGTLVVQMWEDPDGTTAAFGSVPTGTLLPIRVKKVLATGTTATNLVTLI